MSHMPHGIRMTKISGKDCCDFCGLDTKVLISEPFDNGNASDTVIRICRHCVRNLDNLFDIKNESLE